MRLWTGSMTVFAVAGVLAGCNRASDKGAEQTAAANATPNAALPALPQALPMQAGAATASGIAPSAGALSVSAPVRVASLPSSGDAYAYLDRAAGQSDAYGDAPPDYAFDYDGVSPWAWHAGDGSTEYAEPVEGGYRSYYYEPGQDEPYLVRDGDYSYAYAGGALVAIYLGGRLLRHEQWGDRARYAAGYRDRAEHLYRASGNRRGVVAANWAGRRQQIVQQRSAFAADRSRQPDWSAYHRDHDAQEQAHWAQDRERRAVAARQFDDWREQGYRGPAPDVRYARPASDRAPDVHQPSRAQPEAPGAPDRHDGRPPSAVPRPERPSPAADRPAAAPRIEQPRAPVPDRPTYVHERVRAPMLGSDAQRLRERGVRPLEAPRHEPQQDDAGVPSSTGPRVAVHRGSETPDMSRVLTPEHPVPSDRASPKSRAIPERATPPIERRATPHIDAPRPTRVEAPHEAPHPAVPRGSAPHSGDRR